VATVKRQAPEPRQTQGTILVADDEELIRTLASRFLAQSGFNVLSAVSGEDALKQSRNHKGDIHLLLSDIEMPGIKGVELAEKLTLERPEIKVILISGYSTQMLILNHGWHFLPKPFAPARLRDLISSVLAPGGKSLLGASK